VSAVGPTDANARYPAVVLGPGAAEQLGMHETGADTQVWLGGRWFTVVGLLATNAPNTRRVNSRVPNPGWSHWKPSPSGRSSWIAAYVHGAG